MHWKLMFLQLAEERKRQFSALTDKAYWKPRSLCPVGIEN
jgi:hypothetical protein